METKVTASSSDYSSIYDAAEEYDEKLLASDRRFLDTAIVCLNDGSYFKWSNAFLMCKEQWVIVFSEHYKFHIFDVSEISFYEQLTPSLQHIKEL